MFRGIFKYGFVRYAVVCVRVCACNFYIDMDELCVILLSDHGSAIKLPLQLHVFSDVSQQLPITNSLVMSTLTWFIEEDTMGIDY